MRFSWFLLPVVLAVIAASTGAVSRPPENHDLDFERGPTGQPPVGWSAQTAIGHGFRVAVTEKRPHGGRRCVEIRRESVTLNLQGQLGALERQIDATPYRGRRIRLSGWLRFVPAVGPWNAGSARLWVRVDRPGGRRGFYDVLGAGPVRSTEWTYARIVGDVAPDADSIAFGAALETYGTMWADDLSLELLGPIGEGDQPPRALSDRGADNLVTFARLLGYVRHFHPSDQAKENDWESFAIAGVDEVESARSPAELAATLDRLFRPFAPTLRLATHRLPALTPSALVRFGERPLRVTGWWHHGWAGGPAARTYYARRIEAPVDARTDSILPVGSEVNLDLGGGVWCSVPLTLYADARGTLPRGKGAPRAPRRLPGWIPSGNDRGTRLADVILFWNAAQHFYPYFDVVHTDWSAQLPPALKRAAADRDGASFERTLQRMVAQLKDGHGAVNSPFTERTPLPLAWSLVEGRLVVLRADSTLVGRVHPGDEVTAIQGRPVSEWVKDAEAIQSAATAQHLRFKVAQMIQVLPGIGADTVALDLRSPAGITRRVGVARRFPWLTAARPDSVTEVRRGVMYLDLDRITDADFLGALPRIMKAKGVIFDLRGYPRRISTIVLAHLIDSTITCARWNIPLVRRPDRHDMAFEFSNWTVPPGSPRIGARVAFLIDGRAVSYAETYLGMVEHYRLAELVGEPTAGTNGNITTQHLPGGYVVAFTGMKVLKHDQSRHHGVGILPTVPISPTLAGVAAGRDEQLEKAIEVVSR
jgi:C-terminal processing protease CtpA/Prc